MWLDSQNGVRVGNVSDHKDRNKRSGTCQSWFPKSWSDKDIKRAGEHVAGLKGNCRIPDGKTIYGVYKGVHVGVKRTNGKLQPFSLIVFNHKEEQKVIKEKIAEIVEERIRICEETGDNWDYGIEQCWKK